MIDCRRREPDPVVGQHEGDLLIIGIDRHDDRRRVGVFADIDQRFAENAQDSASVALSSGTSGPD